MEFAERGTKDHKAMLLVFLAFLGGCAPIGPKITSNPWLCGDATSETVTAVCSSKPTGRYYGIIESYTGPVKPVNFSEAVPHGRGNITVDGEIIEASFALGSISKIKVSDPAGWTFSGTVNNNLSWLNGDYQTPQLSFEGTFSGKLRPKSGTLISKVTGDRFSGVVTSRGIDVFPQKGVLSRKKDNCRLSSYGSFTTDLSGRVVRNPRGAFNLDHPFGKISGDFVGSKIKDAELILYGTNVPPTLNLKEVEFSLKNGFLGSVATENSFLYPDASDKGIYWTKIDWSKMSLCDSMPSFKRESAFLEPTETRYVISDSYISAAKRRNFYLKQVDSLKKEPEQLLMIKYTDKVSDRKITKRFDQQSQYVSGTREVYNSDYDVAQAQVLDAQSKLAQERAKDASRWADSPCTGSIFQCALADSLLSGTSEAQKVYDEAVAKLSRTSRMLSQKIYSDYEIEKVAITATKSANLVFAFFDFKNGITYREKIPLTKVKKFEVISSPIADSDVQKRKLLQGTSKENDIDEWFEENISHSFDLQNIFLDLKVPSNKLRLSQLNQMDYARKLLKGNSAIKTSTHLQPEEKSKAIVESLFPGRVIPTQYELEDSILVVERLNGMGTGFFVTDSHVITNQHVVEGSTYLDLRTFKGEKFSGRVLATDIATDLAILRVTKKGVPLKLHDSCAIKRRENVFTIGHPKGFEYSTSRGIVSAIRDMPQPFYPESGIRKRYIQIDASISSGNSGGPLFNSDERVIGVNTWGRTDGQNLNFAVHCSEVKTFLRETNIIQ